MKNEEIVKTEVRGGSGRLCGTDDICTMTYRSESQLFRHFYFAAWKVKKQSIQHPESRQQGRADDKNRTNIEKRPVAAVAVCDSRAWKVTVNVTAPQGKASSNGRITVLKGKVFWQPGAREYHKGTTYPKPNKRHLWTWWKAEGLLPLLGRKAEIGERSFLWGSPAWKLVACFWRA